MSRPQDSACATGSLPSQLRSLLDGRLGTVAVLALASVLSGFAEAAILASVAEVATVLVNDSTHVHATLGPLHLTVSVWAMLGIAAALAIMRLLLQAPISIVPARMAGGVQAQLRRRLFGAFTRASWAVQSRDREGHLQEMMTNQVFQATQGTLQAATLVIGLLTFLVLVISAFALNLLAAAVVLGAAMLLFALLRPLNTLGARRARALSQAQMEFAGAVGESIRVAEETRVFGVAAAQRARIDRYIVAARDLFVRTQLIGRIVPSIYQSLIYAILIGGLAGLYAAGAGHLASLGAVVLLLVRAGTYGQQMQGAYMGLRQSLPFIERLEAAERSYAASSRPAGLRPLHRIESLAFDEVSYEYRPGRPVLTGISFEVGAGETIGVVGPSGAGKSTLVQILLQLRTPARGKYLVNGVCAEELASEDWHRQVAYVPQEPRLLHASVTENIRYYRDISDADVERAARLARIHDDIIGWPDGYAAVVGPRADAVSGGQQQRICLARALAAQPDVIVLDEPTSALDPRSEALIQESLMGLEGKVTLFIVAHRMSTLDSCGRVMVIVDGRLEAFDSAELLHVQSSYYRTAMTLIAGGDLQDQV